MEKKPRITLRLTHSKSTAIQSIRSIHNTRSNFSTTRKVKLGRNFVNNWNINWGWPEDLGPQGIVRHFGPPLGRGNGLHKHVEVAGPGASTHTGAP